MAALTLATAGNVLAPAYLVLRAKGYDISREQSARGDEHWIATGPLGRFIAEDTISLLGLVAVAEARGPQWQASDAEVALFLSACGMSGGG